MLQNWQQLTTDMQSKFTQLNLIAPVSIDVHNQSVTGCYRDLTLGIFAVSVIIVVSYALNTPILIYNVRGIP